MTSSLPTTVDPAAIQEVLDGRWAHVRRDAREQLGDPEYAPVYGEGMQEARELASELAGKLAGTGATSLEVTIEESPGQGASCAVEL